MPRLCAFLILAGLAVASVPRRRPAPEPVARALTPAECRLLFMPTRRTVH